VRREAGKKLLEAMQRLRDANLPPLTEADIETASASSSPPPSCVTHSP
jgi:hypothetical protein